MKFTKRDARLALLLLSVLIFFFAYQFGCQKISTSLETVREKNADLQNVLLDLQSKKPYTEEYKQTAAKNAADIAHLLDAYPPAVFAEDWVTFAADRRVKHGFDIHALTFGALTEDRPIALQTARNTAPQTFTPGMSLASMEIRNVSYAEFKRFLRDIPAETHRTAIQSIAVDYNQASGNLDVKVALAKGVLGGNGTYLAPKTGSSPAGNANLFRTTA